jgi:hypothetical protein
MSSFIPILRTNCLLSSPSARISAAAPIDQDRADGLPEQTAAQRTSQLGSKRKDIGETRLKESEREVKDDRAIISKSS